MPGSRCAAFLGSHCASGSWLCRHVHLSSTLPSLAPELLLCFNVSETQKSHCTRPAEVRDRRFTRVRETRFLPARGDGPHPTVFGTPCRHTDQGRGELCSLGLFPFERATFVAGTRTFDAREVSLLTGLVLAGHPVAPYTEVWECGSQFPARCLIVSESTASKGTETLSKTLAILGEIANH